MPRLRDLPTAIRTEGLWKFLLAIYNEAMKDDLFVWASALAYSWLLAIFPFLIFLLTLVPYIPEKQKAEVLNGIEGFLRQLPAETADTLRLQVDATVRRVLMETQSGLMSLGIIMTLWVASGGMAQTMTALDRCYDITEGRKFYWQRLLAIALTIVTATLMILVVVLLPVGGLVLTWIWDNSRGLIGYQLPDSLRLILDIARWSLGLFLLTSVLNIIYHFGCRVRRQFRFLTPGALFCVLTWIALGLAFRLYVDRIAIQGYNKTYGTIGGVVILLVLFYFAAIVLLIGAEINSEVDYTVYKAPRGTTDFRQLERALIAEEKEAAGRIRPSHND